MNNSISILLSGTTNMQKLEEESLYALTAMCKTVKEKTIKNNLFKVILNEEVSLENISWFVKNFVSFNFVSLIYDTNLLGIDEEPCIIINMTLK